MALTTTVTPAAIAVALGRPAPSEDSVTDAQWSMWIADALRLVQHRLTEAAVDEDVVVQTDLDYVIREAVVSQVKAPDDATLSLVSGDDRSQPRAFRPGSGRVFILSEWWAQLGLAPTKGKGFMVDLMPPGAGEVDQETYWWTRA